MSGIALVTINRERERKVKMEFGYFLVLRRLVRDTAQVSALMN